MEHVLTGSLDKPAIIATMALESTPPERKAPNGTSDNLLISTASFSRYGSSSIACCSVMVLSIVKGIFQYCLGCGNG